ncbi:MAG TPA: polyprenyl synthetase family protein [Blastocatellia bacterium]|nr:polyprenyl synthetase family protein [Blastocatellia bacterium]
MTITLQHFVAHHRPKMEVALFEYLPYSRKGGTQRFNEALHYALFPGGKRWRPFLTLLGGMIVGANPQAILPAACAMEFLHTSSMILDDLPAMDDADTRRGKPALHLAYDESTAVLVALALMNHSYSLLALTCQKLNHNELAGRLISQAAEWIGADGMIGGQVVDLELWSNDSEFETLVSRNLKTTALMKLTMTAGAIAANAYETEIAALARFGEVLGMAYQICDDLLDELGDDHVIGKPKRQDTRHQRPNFVNKYGIVEARRIADELVKEGKEGIQKQFSHRQEVILLTEAADTIVGAPPFSLAPCKYEMATVS